MFTTSRKLFAEGLGTALLLAIVVGSGIMGESLAGGNTAIALLGNTLATGAGLVVLITIFGPISGAHFNPVVTLAFAARREIGLKPAIGYILTQVAGAVIGVGMAHAMFGQSIVQVSTKLRDGTSLVFSEGVATFGLIATIFGCIRFKPDFTPVAVGLYITAAYWFTASTSFANPAVTLARSLTETFAGIAPASVSLFVAAQCAGAGLAVIIFGWLFSDQTTSHPITSEADL
ncbi:MIP family protein [Asticcacaulis sp. AC460]|uniref:MIP/aquaporin family protein n=1 Tax=Asticcacaulis sp. AC460 TaxID=1282360 RepID=UPI0003C40953|nr:MIP/aquaporin family protein [Asticcacaulis sp. AC460]ESQ85370.1 MIP family protein [Asticcacaulis sp. AC460]